MKFLARMAAIAVVLLATHTYAATPAADPLVPPAVYLPLYPAPNGLDAQLHTQRNTLAKQIAPLLLQCNTHREHEPDAYATHDAWATFITACAKVFYSLSPLEHAAEVWQLTAAIRHGDATEENINKRFAIMHPIVQHGLPLAGALHEAFEAYQRLRILTGGPRLPAIELPFDPSNTQESLLQVWKESLISNYATLAREAPRFVENGALTNNIPHGMVNNMFEVWNLFNIGVLDSGFAAENSQVFADLLQALDPHAPNMQHIATALAIELQWTALTYNMVVKTNTVALIADPSPMWN